MGVVQGRVGRTRHPPPLRARQHAGDQPGQRVGDGLGIAGRAPDAVDPRDGDGGEEGLEVEAYDHRTPGVGGGVRAHRPARPEAPGRLVRGDAGGQLVEQEALDGAQALLGRLDDPDRAARRRDVGDPVVLQRRGRGLAGEVAGVGEPVELADGDAEQPGEVVEVVENRQAPPVGEHAGAGDRTRARCGAAGPLRGGPRGDHGGELAGPVVGWARHEGEHLAHQRSQPRRPGADDDTAGLEQRRLAPLLTGQEAGGERPGEVVPHARRPASRSGCGSASRPVPSCARRPAAERSDSRAVPSPDVPVVRGVAPREQTGVTHRSAVSSPRCRTPVTLGVRADIGPGPRSAGLLSDPGATRPSTGRVRGAGPAACWPGWGWPRRAPAAPGAGRRPRRRAPRCARAGRRPGARGP